MTPYGFEPVSNIRLGYVSPSPLWKLSKAVQEY
jgi:hypothetical protein